jgi:hypothetical protein
MTSRRGMSPRPDSVDDEEKKGGELCFEILFRPHIKYIIRCTLNAMRVQRQIAFILSTVEITSGGGSARRRNGCLILVSVVC